MRTSRKSSRTVNTGLGKSKHGTALPGSVWRIPRGICARGTFVSYLRRAASRPLTLARLNRRDPRKQESWFLIKGHDDEARERMDALAIEQETPFPSATLRPSGRKQGRNKKAVSASSQAPARGAVRGALPERQAPRALSASRGAAGGRGVDLRDQVRRLPPARIGRRRAGPPAHPQRPRLGRPNAITQVRTAAGQHPGSVLQIVKGAGQMVHHLATRQVAQAVEGMAETSRAAP